MSEDAEPNIDDIEKRLHYVKRFTERGDFDTVLLILLDDAERADEHKRTRLIDHIRSNDLDLYCRIVVGFFNESQLFLADIRMSDLIENENIKDVLVYIENRFREDQYDINTKLTMYQVILSFYMLSNIQFDPVFVSNRIEFMKTQGIPPESLTAIERFMSFNTDGISFQDKMEIGIEQMKSTATMLKKTSNQVQIDDFIAFQKFAIDKLLQIHEYDYAYDLAYTLHSEFPDNRRVQDSFMIAMQYSKGPDQVYEFISDHFTEEEINEDPGLLMLYSGKFQKSGRMADAIRYSKRAYDISDHHPGALLQYLVVLWQGKRYDEASLLIREHLSESDDNLMPFHLLLSAGLFVNRMPDVTQEVLDYFSKIFPDLTEDLGDSIPFIQNLSYLHVKALLHMELGEYSEYIECLEKMTEIDPKYSWPHHLLALQYRVGSKDNSSDKEKSMYHAKRYCELTGTKITAFLGLTNLMAGEIPKGIDLLERSLEEPISDISIPIPEIHRLLSTAYYHLENIERSCHHAEKWLDDFNEWKQLKDIHSYSLLFRRQIIQWNDSYLEFIGRVCKNLSNRIDSIIDLRKSWDDMYDISFEISRVREISNQRQVRIEELEQEARDLKERYRNLSDLSDDEWDRFLEKLLLTEDRRLRYLRISNETEWEKLSQELIAIIPGVDAHHPHIQSFIQTAEFALKVNPINADFSGPIIYYSKAIESILHEMITLQIKPSLEAQLPVPIVFHDFCSPMKSIFHWTRPRSISIGQWAGILKGQFDDKCTIIRFFREELKGFLSPVSQEALLLYCDQLSKIRNGSAHTSAIKYPEIREDIDNFRAAVIFLVKELY